MARTPDPDDRRCYRVDLTTTGKAALTVLIPLVCDIKQEMLCDIADEDRQMTINTLKRIADELIPSKAKGETP